MSKLSGLMDVGRKALSNAQVGIRTTAHNIANKSTEGYSRQRVTFQASTPIGGAGRQVGTGADVAEIRSIRNDYLEKQIVGESQEMGFGDAHAKGMYRVEQVFNEQLNKGLNQFISDFFNAFRELSASPENLATRTVVKETAVAMTKDFKRISDQLRDIQKDMDGQIAAEVDEINAIASEIAELNAKIAAIEIQKIPSNDERDQRNLLVKKLSEKIDVKVTENEDGILNVMVGNNAILVSGLSSATLKTVVRGPEDGYRPGNYDVYYVAPDAVGSLKITGMLENGKLGGAVEVRDNIVHNILNQMDELAYGIATEVNKIHIEGFDRFSQDGVLFFDLQEKPFQAAESLQVNDTIIKDVGRIATGYKIHGPGDNRLANKIASLQYNKFMERGLSTVDDFYGGIVGEVAVIAKKSNMFNEHQGKIVKQLENIRESISGVSLDEETTRMLEMQKQFDASSRLIRTADEMMQTVLELKRL